MVEQMNDKVTADFLAYEQLKIQEGQIQDKIKELKAKLIPHITQGQIIKGQHGKFTLKAKPMWRYTKAVVIKEEELDELKAEEVAKGLAKKVETVFIEYRQDKVQQAEQ